MMMRRHLLSFVSTSHRANRLYTQACRPSLSFQPSSIQQFHTSVSRHQEQQSSTEVVEKKRGRPKKVTTSTDGVEVKKPKVKRVSSKKAAEEQLTSRNTAEDEDIVEDEDTQSTTIAKKKKRVTKKKTNTTATTEQAESNGQKEMTEQDIYDKKKEVYEEVSSLLKKNRIGDAMSYLIEWYRFIYTPIHKHINAKERLYKEHVRQILIDAVLLGNYAVCLSSYGDKRLQESMELFEESFKLLERYNQCKKQAQNETGPEAEATRDFMSSKAAQTEIQEAEFAFCFTYGFLLIKRGEYEKGENHLMRACQLNEDHAGIYYRLAVLCKEQGEYERAEKYYDKAIEKLQNPTLIGDFASFYMTHMQKFDRVPELFERALKLSPNHSQNLYNYAVYHYAVKKDTTKAIQLLETAMHDQAVDPRPASYLGSIQLSLGQYEAARRNFMKAKSMGGFMTYSELSHYAIAEQHLGNFEQARDTFAQALKLHDAESKMREKRGESDDSELLGNYGELLFKIYKRYSEAKTLFDRALKSNPKNYSVLNSYAMLMAKLKEFNTADELFNKSVDIDDSAKAKQLKVNLSNYGDYLMNQRQLPAEAANVYNRLTQLVESTPDTDDEYFTEQHTKFIEKYPEYR
jgi:tetratricopeptide (TPR) repeat protein